MKIEIDKPVVPKWFDEWYKTFNADKNQALYYLSRTGWGYPLTDGEDIEVEGCFDKLRDLSDSDSYGYEDAQEYLSKAILLNYEVEKEPLYCAKIKGWELATSKNTYWNYRHIIERPILSKLYVGSNESIESFYTMERWNDLGINDTNADFEEVEVWEVDLSETHKKDGENGK